jgi:hypothetical protein
MISYQTTWYYIPEYTSVTSNFLLGILFNPEDGDSMFIQNMASQQYSS